MAKKPQAAKAQPARLDIGCGEAKREGFIRVCHGKAPWADICRNLTDPWPWAADSVEEIHCRRTIEYIDGPRRVPFMEEMFRVMKVGAKAAIFVPYWSSVRAIQDPFLAFPPLCEQSFLHFNKEWREQNGVAYPIKADFHLTAGHYVEPDLEARVVEYRAFVSKHWLNTAHEMQVVLTKRPPE